jgi:hypothetical protein
MRRTIFTTIAAIILSSSTGLCQDARDEVGVVVRGGIAPGGAITGFSPSEGVFFPSQGTMTLVLQYGCVSASTGAVVPLPDGWWKPITVTIRPVEKSAGQEYGSVVHLEFDPPEPTSTWIEGGEDHGARVLEPGQVASAEFEVALPPPGDYVIEASRRSAFTEQTLLGGNDTISVRRGDEREAIRLLFLKSQRVGREFPEFRAIQMKLLEQQPDNWYLWEELANMSLGEAAFEETLSYYETAERKYRHFLTVTGSPIGDREAAVLTFLGLFARLGPFYREAAHEVTLTPERHGLYRTFRWVERAEDRTRQPSMIRVRGEKEARPATRAALSI